LTTKIEREIVAYIAGWEVSSLFGWAYELQKKPEGKPWGRTKRRNIKINNRKAICWRVRVK
jgi:hypothetical protein